MQTKEYLKILLELQNCVSYLKIGKLLIQLYVTHTHTLSLSHQHSLPLSYTPIFYQKTTQNPTGIAKLC